jgi:hypothetical protein
MNKPTVSELQTIDWKSIDEFPYFQSTRLKIKGLYNQNSFKYNFALLLLTQPTEVFCLISLL